jgi:hypothetical protein
MALAGKLLRFQRALVLAMAMFGATGCEALIWREPTTLEPLTMTQAEAERVLQDYHGPYCPGLAISEADASFERRYTIESATRGTQMAVWFTTFVIPGWGQYCVGWMDPQKPVMNKLAMLLPLIPDPHSPIATRNGATFFRTQDEAVAFAQAIYAKKYQLAMSGGGGGPAMAGASTNAAETPNSRVTIDDALPGRPVAEPPFMTMTPLDWAALRGRKDVAELLLAKEAVTNARDRSGEPLGQGRSSASPPAPPETHAEPPLPKDLGLPPSPAPEAPVGQAEKKGQ